MSSTPTARTSAAALVLAAVLLPSAAAHAATTPTPNKAQVEHSEGLLATTAPALTKAQVEQAERAAGAGPADVPADRDDHRRPDRTGGRRHRPHALGGRRRRRGWCGAHRRAGRGRRPVAPARGPAGLSGPVPCCEQRRVEDHVDGADAEAFRGFVLARGQSLVRAGYVLTGDQQLAEDLVQQALEKAARHWHRIEPGAAEAYVRRTMYRDQVSRWRRRRVAETLTGLVPGARVGSQDDRTADQVAERVALKEALARLGPRQRAVLVLRFYEDLTEREVAELLGIGVGTVKSQSAKALARLRRELPAHAVPVTLRLDDPVPTQEAR